MDELIQFMEDNLADVERREAARTGQEPESPYSNTGSQLVDETADSAGAKSPEITDPHSHLVTTNFEMNLYGGNSGGPGLRKILQNRNSGSVFVELGSFYEWNERNKKKGTNHNYWISGVLIGKSTFVKTSLKGNKYSTWELSDLKNLTQRVEIRLFGAACIAPSLSAVEVGSVVDIIRPRITDTANRRHLIYFVNNISQIKVIGRSTEFQTCPGRSENGARCGKLLQKKWKGRFCVEHSAEIGFESKTTAGVKPYEKHGRPPTQRTVKPCSISDEKPSRMATRFECASVPTPVQSHVPPASADRIFPRKEVHSKPGIPTRFV